MKNRAIKYNLICPSCKFEFQRKFGEKSTMQNKTSCFKCRKIFKRIEFLPDSEIAKLKDFKKKFNILNRNEIPLNIIKGNQVPTSLTEVKFKSKAIEKGWLPHRPSWPDFLVETENGLICVEVKSSKDVVRKDQELTFKLLESYGIKVYIWQDGKEKKDKLISWSNWEKNYQTLLSH